MAKSDSDKEITKEVPTCGIIMPISGNEQYPTVHWTEVLSVIKEVAIEAGFKANLVSYADQTAVIQKTIVENIYSSDIVICDVSSKNPNVMFELGLRLAFDKPTIIIKDERTNYTFDTGIIEHLPYQSDLNYYNIINFKKDLAGKILATHKVATNDPSYSTFLKNFGNYKIVGLEDKEITDFKFLEEKLDALQNSVRRLSTNTGQIRNIEPLILLKDEIVAECLAKNIRRIDEIAKICMKKELYRFCPTKTDFDSHVRLIRNEIVHGENSD